MCGIAGHWARRRSGRDADSLGAQARRMADSMAHRGPDASGVWVDAEAGMAFGHRRLSIVDLSEAGAQPMSSACGRFVICYNAEVYNAPELTSELAPQLAADGARLRGRSDTEIVLEACARLGVRETVDRLIGMFAFALWDRAERRLWLVRDRLGIKPLYWAQTSAGVLFGSEMKALEAHPDCPSEVDRGALAAYLRLGWVPAPRTILAGVQKLEPGCMLSIGESDAEPRIERYWSAAKVAEDGRRAPFEGDEVEAIDALEAHLSDAVRRRMVADVPLGAFLSGGIDSSTVVALMQSASDRPVQTFSIGFEDPDYDEAPHARAVAEHLGTDHHELIATAADAQAAIPRVAALMDEPFADASMVPTLMVSEMARRRVTVALSGDGGDELFAGYTRHLEARRLARISQSLPAPARAAMGAAARSLTPAQWDMAIAVLPERARPRQAGDKIHKWAHAVAAGPGAAHRALLSRVSRPEALMADPGGDEPQPPEPPEALDDPVDAMRWLDLVGYLHDDVLTKVDRASMAASLEARTPLLDHRVVAFAWTLPSRLLIEGGVGKRILRRLLARRVPERLFERPKSGFSVPVAAWMRGPLRSWLGDLLSEEACRRHGLLDPAAVAAALRRFDRGGGDPRGSIWSLAMLQSWAERRRA